MGRFLSGGESSSGGGGGDYQAFTTSGTWTKPAGAPDYATVRVFGIGAGGGGGTGASDSGGGGGAGREEFFSISQLAATETVTIGAGGAAGVAGGSTSFGTLMAVGGGSFGTASNALGGRAVVEETWTSATSSSAFYDIQIVGTTSQTNYVRNAGGSARAGYPGTHTYLGGGGGAAGVYAAGRGILFGGNGGADGVSGTAPGGGGGRNAAGADGACYVWTTW